MNFGARIKQEREALGITQAALAASAGLPSKNGQQAIAAIEDRDSSSSQHAPALAAALGLRLEWALTGAGEKHAKRQSANANDEDWSDVRGYAQAVGLGAAGAEADEYADVHKLKFKSSSLRGKGLHARSLAVFYGKGDSMREIQHGDAVLFDESDTNPLDGELYVISVGGSYQCKRALILDGAVWFESSNPDGAETAWKRPRRMDDRRHPITVVGRAWWIGRWLA